MDERTRTDAGDQLRILARTEAKVAAAVAQHALWAPGAILVAAVSGGADSVCLLGALLALRERAPEMAPAEIVVAHLDHGLRGAAGEADAHYVAELTTSLGLRFVTERADVAGRACEQHLSLEDAARRARYAFLRRIAAEHGAERIATGHTRDDQAETLILHWLRGSGLAGLAGMQPLSSDIARPLLSLTRQETEAYCAARRWPPREDASNADLRFTRNRVRRELLPQLEAFNPNLRETLVRNAGLLADDERYLAAQADAAWQHVVREPNDGSSGAVELDLTQLQVLPAALRHRLFRRAALGALPVSQTEDRVEHALEARHLQLLDRLLAQGHAGDAIDLPNALTVRLGYETLRFEPRNRRLAGSSMQTTPAQPHEVRALSVPGEVEWPRTGWRIRAWLSSTLPGLESRRESANSTGLDRLPAYERVGNNADVGRGERVAYLDADALGITDGDMLAVRAWRPGDRFRPLGMPAEKKLQDYFSDAKVPRELRARLPLIFGPRHLLWVAGQRIDDRGRISPATQRFLVIELEPLSSTATGAETTDE